LCHADWANHTWNSGSARYLTVANGEHKRSGAIDIGTDDDIRSSGYLLNVYRWGGRYIVPDTVRTTSHIIHGRLSGHDHTGAATAVTTAPAVTFRYCSARAGTIDSRERPLYIHAEHHSHDDGIGTGDFTDCDGTGSSVGDHSYANRRHDDRKHFADGPAG
jgi:hypothetical protein